MKVLVTGATGFIGNRLCQALVRAGHEPVVLSRRPEKVRDILNLPVPAFRWSPTEEAPPGSALEGVNGVVHLAGVGIAERRWRAAQKKRIRDSRVAGTRHLVEALGAVRPAVLVSASGIGYYGDRGDEELTERSEPGTGFLADICREWEAAAAPPPGTRGVRLRIGLVLGREGGVLKRLLPLFKSGLAGPVGSGRQYMSWIHADDLVGMILHALENKGVEGPVNGVGPRPVTNREFTRVLARSLGRPAFLPAPAFALKLALGEMAELVLGSQRVKPEAALASGYRFRYPTLEEALTSP